jgi:hypothetical protein
MTALASAAAESLPLPDPPASHAALPPELPAAGCEGYIDFIATRRTFGWAWCRDYPDTPVEVEIRIDDRPVITARADKFRPDLARVGVGDGHHGFDVGLPEFVSLEEKHRVSAYVVVAPGRATVPLINRTVAVAVPRPAAPVQTDAQGQCRVEADRPLICSTQVREALSRVMVGQKAFEASLSALAEDVRQLTSARLGVDTRAEAALAKAIDQLHAVQETLSRQSAAAEVLQARLDGIIAVLGDADATPLRQAGGDRALYWSVAGLAVISLSSLAFGIYSLIG